ncbi:lycopene cyclase domain-containing protein [Thermogemmatispora onikobensis]|uniref:lycopene cyclase domain-containing protein n=1 Tax=Thermogemmatispora onikobensis TaxID=732234 RepID=UPI000852C57E|nr:lycopene cyclase domain-containing protein [Thermogemmatispora onikobensis]
MAHTTYLLFLLVWALPILALQWLLGWRKLWAWRRRWPWAVLLVGSYLTLADSLAIAQHIWFFQPALTLGLTLGNVPLEEALFYFLTAAMIAQGFVLLLPASLTPPGSPPRPEAETPVH